MYKIKIWSASRWCPQKWIISDISFFQNCYFSTSPQLFVRKLGGHERASNQSIWDESGTNRKLMIKSTSLEGQLAHTSDSFFPSQNIILKSMFFLKTDLRQAPTSILSHVLRRKWYQSKAYDQIYNSRGPNGPHLRFLFPSKNTILKSRCVSFLLSSLWLINVSWMA